METEEAPLVEPECEFCEVCGCCFLHSDCAPSYCACAPFIWGPDEFGEDE